MTSNPDYEPLVVAARPELTGDRRIGVLLSHGFTGSPVSMRPWGRYLSDLGYGVRVPLLPGHATTWQDLNTKRWADWYGALSAELDTMLAEHDAVVVAGLSMGGALVLRLAEDRAEEISGVMICNPAVATKRFDVKLLPVLKHLIPSFPGIANDIKKSGVEEHGYTRTPLKAIHSLITSWKPLVADLPKVKAPLIYFRSTIDHVVDEASQPIILDNISSTDVELVPLPESFHVATLDNDAPTIFERSAEFVARVTSL
ncbi:alpha/beta fold hydrolase [Nocardioides humilatus]|uniref:Alpha/beta fold hydrolase n=1 Tax=Nocardioides humilatus TaxID=2607660 RepID=A0A5B1LDV0_9ACTN|nr:alpha/beta fold hydrolase [Nocardioides humilatus]KAA1417960.1 alpha/beta fold hydrolase [Nocardioides humilatus]